MPTWKRHFAPGQLQFLTSSTYRRAPLFACKPLAGAERSSALQRIFVDVLSQLRSKQGFLLIGWVLMPDHFHLLIKPDPVEITSHFMQEFKKRTARRILATLTGNRKNRWCGKMLARLQLPPSVHTDAHFRVWQRRYYPFGVYSEKKRLEKLTYMHNNPVKQGLVVSPDQWLWSSFRFYHLNDSSILNMDRIG